MSITLTNWFDSLTRVKRNIGNVTEASKLEWANTINEQIYDYITRTNPQDYISRKTYQIVSGTTKYARATDFKNRTAPECGIFMTETGTDFGILNYDTETVAFTVGLTVTGTTSWATGVIDELFSDYLVLSDVSGTFEDDELLTDSTTGSATINGTIKAFDRSNELVAYTGDGFQTEGYYEEGSNLVITPKPTETDVIYDKYMPKLTAFTALTESFVDIPYAEGKYLELIRDLLFIQYEVFNRNGYNEQQATIRANDVLQDFFGTINTESKVYII